MGAFSWILSVMKVFTAVLVFGLTVSLVIAEGQHGRRRGRQGRRRGQQQQQQRGARQQFADLGPPPQPQIDIPNLPPPPNRAIPAQPSLPQNRFLPTGPAPGSSLPPESPVRGRIPDTDGNYDFTFETDDGEFRSEQGRVKNVGGENVNEITGEYSWTSPEGELVSFTYKADENGYQAQGSHLPEAPPLHPHIQLGLELIARANRNSNNRKRA